MFIQTPLVELAIPLTLRWKQGRDMPFTMTNSIQAVVIDNQVYVGGGYNFDNGRGVMLYTLHTGSWRTLPRYDSVWFGMAPVNNQLVLVGGAYSSTNRISDILGVWDEGLRMWTHPYPVMPTPRSQVSVVSYQRWLIVAGGLSGGPLCLSNVEILDTSSRQWYEAGSLPIACCAMSSTRNGNMWYLSRGSSSMMSQASNHVFSVNLDNLIAEAVSCSDGVSTPSPWQSLPDTPLVHSTVVVIGGALLTVGGWKSSSIHLYQPSHKRWVKVGELPCMRYQCACAVLPSGELFVTGGCGDIYRVDIATVTSNE